MWGQRLGAGSLVVAKSAKRLHLIGPAVAGLSRMQVDGCILDPNIPFQWVENGHPQSGTVSSFSILRDTSATADAFAQAIQSLVEFLGVDPAGVDLINILEAWLVVLSTPSAPTDAAMVGFWGELLAIKCAADPISAVSMWQWRDAAPIDFSLGATQLEVKTSSSGSRVHSFSVTQTREGVLRGASILSIVTAWSPAGLGLLELVRQVTNLVQSEDAAVKTVAAAVARRVGLLLGPGDCLLDEAQAIASFQVVGFPVLQDLVAVPGLIEGRFRVDLDVLLRSPNSAGAIMRPRSSLPF